MGKEKKWLVENLEVGLEFQECEILFGILFKRDKFFEFLNYLIILGKWFINKVKTFIFHEFSNHSKDKLQSITCKNRVNNGFKMNDTN